MKLAHHCIITIGKLSHSLAIREAMPRHMEVNNRAAFAAAKAIEKILVGIDRETRSILVMQGAEALVGLALALESQAELLAILN